MVFVIDDGRLFIMRREDSLISHRKEEMCFEADHLVIDILVIPALKS